MSWLFIYCIFYLYTAFSLSIPLSMDIHHQRVLGCGKDIGDKCGVGGWTLSGILEDKLTDMWLKLLQVLGSSLCERQTEPIIHQPNPQCEGQLHPADRWVPGALLTTNFLVLYHSSKAEPHL